MSAPSLNHDKKEHVPPAAKSGRVQGKAKGKSEDKEDQRKEGEEPKKLRTDTSARPRPEEYGTVANLSEEEFKRLDKKYNLQGALQSAPPEFIKLMQDPSILCVNWAVPVLTLVVLMAMLLRHAQAFSYKSEDVNTELGCFTLFKFTFEVIKKLPVMNHRLKAGRGRYSGPVREALLKEVSEKLRLHVWTDNPTDDPNWAPEYCSYIHGVLQKNKIRTVIDLIILNMCTLAAVWPPNRISDLMNWIFKEKFLYISSFDMKSAYHQLVNDEAIWKYVGLITPERVLVALRMQFGHAQAVAYLARAVFMTFKSSMWTTIASYFDDLITKGPSSESALDAIGDALQRLIKVKLKLSLEKSSWLMKELMAVGFLVSREGIRVDPERCKVFTTWPRPVDAAALQAFLGATGYLQNLIAHYSNMINPMQQMLSRALKLYHEWKKVKAAKAAVKAPPPVVLDAESSYTSARKVMSAATTNLNPLVPMDDRAPSLEFDSATPVQTKSSQHDQKRFLSGVKLNWTPEADAAFLKTRTMIAEGLRLAPFNEELVVVVESDASDTCIGGILCQMRDDVAVPVAYFSRMLNEAERFYPAIKKELLAVVESRRKFRDYINGRKFIHISDQMNVPSMFNYDKTDTKMRALIVEMSEWNLFHIGA